MLTPLSRKRKGERAVPEHPLAIVARHTWRIETMKKSGNSDVTVIVPARNEEGNVSMVLQELTQMGYHSILLTDANSVDRTVETAKEFGADAGGGGRMA